MDFQGEADRNSSSSSSSSSSSPSEVAVDNPAEEPADLPEVPPPGPRQPARNLQFGPFYLARVKGQPGAVNIAWQAECPYHRNEGDVPGTKCKKRLQTNSEEETIMRLQLWCMEGLKIGRDERTMPRSRHLDVNPRFLPTEGVVAESLHERLEDMLEASPCPAALRRMAD